MSSPKDNFLNSTDENLAHIEEPKVDPSSSETIQLTNSSNDTDESVAVLKSSKSGKCRKNDQCVQQALRSLNRLSTSEEKFTAICAKYADIFDENRKLQATFKEQQKQIATLNKEKDHSRSELMKTIFTKDKLENLCRELQRQNREIRDESIQKIKEEEQKRKEVSSKFQTTLNEITELMKQDSDKTTKLRDDNVDMTTKLKSIYEQYEIREQQVERMTKQMALESQLYEAKIAKLEMETAAEKEVLLREKQQLLLTLTEYQAKFQEYQNIEVTLRNQVALYNNKYEEFEKSLTRSNKVFGGFKSEIENMSNKIVKLESETATWKLRWEKTQKALIEMASEKQKSDQEIVLAAKQMATLHKLCRTLQSERTQLLAKLKQSSLANNSSEKNSCTADDTSDLLGKKIVEENLQVCQVPAEGEDAKNGSSVQTKSSQVADRSPGVPKTKSKTDKKHPVPAPPFSQNNSVKELDVAVAQIDSQENLKNSDTALVSVPLENPNLVSAEETSVSNDGNCAEATECLHQPNETSRSCTDSSPIEEVESDLKCELPNDLNSNSDAVPEKIAEETLSADALQAITSIPLASEGKISTALSESTSAPIEFVLKNSIQSNQKKTQSKKKNKK